VLIKVTLAANEINMCDLAWRISAGRIRESLQLTGRKTTLSIHQLQVQKSSKQLGM
jgi:hypothetical protein